VKRLDEVFYWEGKIKDNRTTKQSQPFQEVQPVIVPVQLNIL
jgi:hypothetical protein